MKIDFSKIPAEFNKKEISCGGEIHVWVTPPHYYYGWTPDTLIFRSSIWRKSDGELISGGLKKFFNYGERPEINTIADDRNEVKNCMEKLDGSCLIVSKYNGEYLFRTRSNRLCGFARRPRYGFNEEHFRTTFPKLFAKAEDLMFMLPTWPVSLIFEWLQPKHTIVIKHEKEDYILTNVVYHDKYLYFTQPAVEYTAKLINAKTPKRHSFDSLSDLKELTKSLTNSEGFCVYHNHDQYIHKFKSDWYVAKSKEVDELTYNKVVKQLIKLGYKSTRKQLEEHLLSVADWEHIKAADDVISDVIKVQQLIMVNEKKILERIKPIIDLYNRSKSREAAAALIAASYGFNTAAVFNIYYDKPHSDKLLNHLFEECHELLNASNFLQQKLSQSKTE